MDLFRAKSPKLYPKILKLQLDLFLYHSEKEGEILSQVLRYKSIAVLRARLIRVRSGFAVAERWGCAEP